MKISPQPGRGFFGIAMAVYGAQQIYYGDFRQVQVPAWQFHVPLLRWWAILSGICLIVSAVAIFSGKKAREVLLALGGVFLFLFLFIHIPFEIFGEVNSSAHLALWTSALKELALAGGAFVIAGSFPEPELRKNGRVITLLEKLIPLGGIFFSVTMISFGIMHFMYGEFVAGLVPSWIPDHLFWTYFSAVALIGSGMSIVLKIRTGAIAMLMSLMLLLWVILLHIPRAFADPFGNRGNELSSVFDALAFCGTAFVISLRDVGADLREMLGR